MVQSKHFLIACGGTGGHLSPGIAVAQELTARGHRCKLLISEKRVDQALCGAYPELEFIPLSGIGFSKKLSNLPRCLWAAFKNIAQSFRLLRQTRTDAVIGFGGFINIGIVLAAKFLRKPCFLHEANRIPGRAVRTLGRWATVVYVPEIFQKQQLRMKVCGFPIRQEFQKLDKAVAKKELGFDPKKLLLVVVGGSQGARVLTQWAREHVKDFKGQNLQLLCLTGVRNNTEGAADAEVGCASVSEMTKKCGNKVGQRTKAVASPIKPETDNSGAIQKTAVIPEGGDGAWRNETVASEVNFSDTADDKNKAFELKTEHVAKKEHPSSELSDTSSSAKPFVSVGLEDPSIHFIPFCNQMHIVYSAADVVIGRAGAGTIAELTVCETPSILVPFPTSADGHQLANARAFEQQGGCVCLEQSDLTKLWEKVHELLSDKEKRFEISKRLRTLNTIDATRMMVTDIERILGTV